jgi:hypothetical protein
MHELYWDCLEAHDLLRKDALIPPPWIQDVIVMSFVKGQCPSEHDYHPLRPAA